MGVCGALARVIKELQLSEGKSEQGGLLASSKVATALESVTVIGGRQEDSSGS